MKPYSEDLRERVVRAAIGTPRDDVAAMFAVSVPSIERWLRQKRETGGLAPKPVPGRRELVKMNAVMEALPARLADRADATLEEQCSWWHEQSGVEVSTATMSRALTRLGWTRKKSR